MLATHPTNQRAVWDSLKSCRRTIRNGTPRPMASTCLILSVQSADQATRNINSQRYHTLGVQISIFVSSAYTAVNGRIYNNRAVAHPKQHNANTNATLLYRCKSRSRYMSTIASIRQETLAKKRK